MMKTSFFKAIIGCLIIAIAITEKTVAQKVNISTSPATAKIYVDGRLRGTGTYIVGVGKKDCVTVEVKEDGYMSEVRTYCNKRGYDDPPKSEYIQLKADEALSPSNVTVTSTPQTAKIYVNGVVMGTGNLQVSVPFGDCITVEVKEEGFIPEIRDYCKKKGMAAPPKSDYYKLQPDESYTSTIQSDIANKELVLNVKSDRTKEEAWKIIVSTILGKFDVLEMNDEKSGYLRTSWVGKIFKANTVRMRVIIKQSSDDPLSYKI
ncbi:MAG TPA: PEGA domain-containing protein, partial [Ferruginibacter sp.]|nr:PEGA domain-containing protein [Ferruginibacter sp.]